jgi:glucose-1-phosphate cytidylyltransferase
MFMANYSDGLTDVDLDDVLERFRLSGKVACFLAVRPPLTYHVADLADDGSVLSMKAARQSEIWINGGFFIFRPEIFEYMREGEELVVEPFQRLIEADQLMAYRHDGFWQSMDTVRDRALLEDLVAKGCVPWKAHSPAKPARELEAIAL